MVYAAIGVVAGFLLLYGWVARRHGEPWVPWVALGVVLVVVASIVEGLP